MSDKRQFRLPISWRERAGMFFLVAVVLFGGYGGGMRLKELALAYWQATHASISIGSMHQFRQRIPKSVLPGPPRASGNSPEPMVLTESDSLRMICRNDPRNERWCDIAGNFYTRSFSSQFSYEAKGSDAPEVRVKIEADGYTLKGRIEARRLKPNFCYQIKLAGDFGKDRIGFEIIGGLGRWRLPGRATNYVDEDYRNCPEDRKREVEAYIFFDYFVADGCGNAVREFALDNSLHVLWLLHQSDDGVMLRDLTEYSVLADDPQIYTRPKTEVNVLYLWAEREIARYSNADQRIYLPARTYHASLLLTEESFHSIDIDGGWWATVASVPISFQITGGGNDSNKAE